MASGMNMTKLEVTRYTRSAGASITYNTRKLFFVNHSSCEIGCTSRKYVSIYLFKFKKQYWVSQIIFLQMNGIGWPSVMHARNISHNMNENEAIKGK